MPTKLRGMTSLEIAIIVGIVLIIAVAVGWYLYTTFTASTTGQPRLNVVSATMVAGSKEGKLTLRVTNPGPVDVEISQVEVAGTPGNMQPAKVLVKVGETKNINATFSGNFTAGTMLPGRVILSGGQSFPFNANVVPQSK